MTGITVRITILRDYRVCIQGILSKSERERNIPRIREVEVFKIARMYEPEMKQ